MMVPWMMGCVRGRAEHVNGVKTGCHSEQDGRGAVSVPLSTKDPLHPGEIRVRTQSERSS